MKSFIVLGTLMLLSAAASVTTVANATNSEIEHPVKSLYKDRECSVLVTKMNREALPEITISGL